MPTQLLFPFPRLLREKMEVTKDTTYNDICNSKRVMNIKQRCAQSRGKKIFNEEAIRENILKSKSES